MNSTNATTTSAISPFQFETHSVRVIVRNGEPWFVARDVCQALGIINNRDAIEKLDEDEKGVASTDTLGGQQQTTIISESGVFTLILRHRDATTQGTAPHRQDAWVATQFLSTSSIRACQPDPVERKNSTTSGEYLTDSNTLLEPFVGLPLGTGRIAIISASVGSYVSGSSAMPAAIMASSSSVGIFNEPLRVDISPYLSAVGLAQTDDPANVAPIHKYDTVQPITKWSVSDHACLAVIAPLIRIGNGQRPIQLIGGHKGNAMLDLVGRIFGRVEDNFHGGYCSYKKLTQQLFSVDTPAPSRASSIPHLQQSGVGVRIPSCPEALKRPSSHVGAFFASDMRMAGCVGVSSETPVSSGTGNANLAQPATFLIRISGGRHLSFSLRSLTMNTRKSNNARTTSFSSIIPAIKKFLARNEFNRLVTAPLGVNRLVTVEVRS